MVFGWLVGWMVCLFVCMRTTLNLFLGGLIVSM